MSTLQHRLAAAQQRRPSVDNAPATPRRLAILSGALVEWLRRWRSRESLGRLTERELRDVGLTQADVVRECGKPFWRA
jgi:uncharacterized protein YjiS (DUF1127 family)